MQKIKETPRMITYIYEDNGETVIKKVAKRSDNFDRCQLADMGFGEKPWMTKWLNTDNQTWFTIPYYDKQFRLDEYKAKLNHDERIDVAADIMNAALEIYLFGLAHRDIHAKNVFVIDGQIKLIDFEYLEMIDGDVPSFWDSYDITGEGLPSPGNSGKMCFTKDDPMAILKCLDVTMEEVKSRLEQKLLDELIGVSGGFHSKDGTHTRNKGSVYASFNIPNFKVGPELTQRNTEKRLEKFGIKESDIKDKEILDLGSNTGAVIFALQKYGPKSSTGLEYCDEMNKMAEKIAAFAGFTTIEFYHYNIDEIISGEFEDYDVVFALAINKHVKDAKRLYEYLGRATKETLYFEANGGTESEEVVSGLREAGFTTIEELGTCDDDIKSSNNNRLLFKATK